MSVPAVGQLVPPDGDVRRDVLNMLRKFYSSFNDGDWNRIKKDSIYETADGLRFGIIVTGIDKLIAHLKELYAAGYRYSVSYDEFGVWIPDRDLVIVAAQKSMNGCERHRFAMEECGPESEIHMFRFYYGEQIGSYPKISRLVLESWI